MDESHRVQDRGNSETIDNLIHGLLIGLDDESLTVVGQSFELLVWRHFRSCKDCEHRHDDALEAYRRNLPAEMQARLGEVAILLAATISEQFNEKKHLRYAVEASIEQRRLDPAMEAFEKILKRHRILEQIAAARVRDDTTKVLELAQKLRLYDLESWAEKA